MKFALLIMTAFLLFVGCHSDSDQVAANETATAQSVPEPSINKDLRPPQPPAF